MTLCAGAHLVHPLLGDAVAFMQARNVSVGEVVALLALFGGGLFLDVAVAASDDDVAGNAGLLLLLLFGLSLALVLVALDVQYLAGVSGASSGDARARQLYTDAVTNLLACTRLVFCWVRYCFYELQSEALDLPLHHTAPGEGGLAGLGAASSAGALDATAGGLWAAVLGAGAALATVLELSLLAFQLLLGYAKLGLALYLYWLLLDLTLLRCLAATEGAEQFARPRRAAVRCYSFVLRAGTSGTRCQGTAGG